MQELSFEALDLVAGGMTQEEADFWRWVKDVMDDIGRRTPNSTEPVVW